MHLVAVVFNLWYVWRLKPFNYGRFNLWSNVLNIAVIWLCVMGLMVIGGVAILPIFCLIFIGLGIIALAGLFVQHKYRAGRYRGLLYLPKSHKIEHLFRYQFGLVPDETKSNVLVRSWRPMRWQKTRRTWLVRTLASNHLPKETHIGFGCFCWKPSRIVVNWQPTRRQNATSTWCDFTKIADVGTSVASLPESWPTMCLPRASSQGSDSMSSSKLYVSMHHAVLHNAIVGF